MAREFCHAPLDSQSAKHCHVGARIGDVRVEKCAVPIEEDGARGKSLSLHDVGIVSEKRDLAAVVAFGQDIVAAEREIVEAGRITSPARGVRSLCADNMRRSAHLDGAHPHRAFH